MLMEVVEIDKMIAYLPLPFIRVSIYYLIIAHIGLLGSMIVKVQDQESASSSCGERHVDPQVFEWGLPLDDEP